MNMNINHLNHIKLRKKQKIIKHNVYSVTVTQP